MQSFGLVTREGRLVFTHDVWVEEDQLIGVGSGSRHGLLQHAAYVKRFIRLAAHESHEGRQLHKSTDGGVVLTGDGFDAEAIRDYHQHLILPLELLVTIRDGETHLLLVEDASCLRDVVKIDVSILERHYFEPLNRLILMIQSLHHQRHAVDPVPLPWVHRKVLQANLGHILYTEGRFTPSHVVIK